MPAGVSNGTMIRGKRREDVIFAIAQGETVDSIAKRFHMGLSTIARIRESEWERIEARKPILAAQAEAGALECGEKVLEAVRNGDIKGAALVPAYGVFIDKALALRGDNVLNVKHTHTHTHQHELLSALNSAVEKIAKANVVDAQPLPLDDSPPSSLGSAQSN